MAASHKGLGKGLGSLFGDEAQQENTVSRLLIKFPWQSWRKASAGME